MVFSNSRKCRIIKKTYFSKKGNHMDAVTSSENALEERLVFTTGKRVGR